MVSDASQPASAGANLDREPQTQRSVGAHRAHAAHTLRNVSYVGTLIGLLISMYHLFRQAEESTADLSQAKSILEAEIAERKRAQETMRLQTAALQSAAHSIVITDRQGLITWVNPAFSKLTGYALDEVVGQNTRILNSGKHDRSFYQDLWDTILSGNVWHGEIVNRRKNDTLYTEEQTITPVRDAQGEISHFIAIKHDVTDRKHAEEALRWSEATAKALLNAPDAASLLLDRDGNILILNQVAHQRLCATVGVPAGGDPEEFLGRCVYDLFPPELSANRRERNEDVIRTKKLSRFEDERNGIWMDHAVFPILDAQGEVSTLAVFSYDITILKRAEETLARSLENERERARRDPLTGLLNHGAIVSELEELLRAPSSELGHFIAMVDIDGLKRINDTYGHVVGDSIIVTVANALEWKDAIVGRYGGDEFVVILPHATSDDARRFQASVEHTLKRVRVHDPVSGVEIEASASIGLSPSGGKSDTTTTLIEQADDAMYAVKRQRHEDPSDYSSLREAI